LTDFFRQNLDLICLFGFERGAATAASEALKKFQQKFILGRIQAQKFFF